MLPIMETEKLVGNILEKISEYARTHHKQPTILRIGKNEHKLLKMYATRMVDGCGEDEDVQRFAGLDVMLPATLCGYEVV